MTLEEKATNYCNEMMCTVCSNIRCEYKGKCTEWETRKRYYLAGAKENGVVWHDLRKDQNDLPKRDKDFVVEVTIPVMTHPSYVFATYYFDNKKWFSNGEEIKVTAWCEIPQFKE